MVQLFTIINKETSEMQSTNLIASEVHYLFIDKKWNRDKCVIKSKVGTKMNYHTFSKLYPLL